MASTCDVCGKKPSFGMSVSHSTAAPSAGGARTSSRCAVVAPGTVRRVNVCTGCLKAGKVTKATRA
ncbi:MAG: L28 family ribosomal protein [Acidimicrobiales bacterium]